MQDKVWWIIADLSFATNPKCRETTPVPAQTHLHVYEPGAYLGGGGVLRVLDTPLSLSPPVHQTHWTVYSFKCYMREQKLRSSSLHESKKLSFLLKINKLVSVVAKISRTYLLYGILATYLSRILAMPLWTIPECKCTLYHNTVDQGFCC